MDTRSGKLSNLSPADLLLFFPTPLVILRVHPVVRLLDFLLVSLFRFKLLDASRRRKSRRSTGICKRVSSVGLSVSTECRPRRRRTERTACSITPDISTTCRHSEPPQSADNRRRKHLKWAGRMKLVGPLYIEQWRAKVE